MLRKIINFFKGDDDLDFDAIDAKLDALEKAADARIAEKQAYLEKLTANVEANKEAVKDLEDTVNRLRKAVKQEKN